MSYALNEVEAMAKRAARGAGYDWGLAEEAAKATRWLAAHGQDGPAVLAALLDAGFAASLAAHTPDTSGPNWRAASRLCPLATGTALSDRAAQAGHSSLTLHAVACPALILPFAASVASVTGQTLTLTCDGATALVDAAALSLTGAFPADATTLTLRPATPPDALPRPNATRATPDPAAWATLTRFAHRTYAPATDESRRLGAGAGLSDND